MKKNDTNDLFEQLLREGASLAAEEMSKNAQEDNTDFSEEHQNKMKRFFARERRKQRIKRAGAYTARIAAVLVIVVAASGLAIFRVDALRVRILNMFTNSESTNTDVVFREGETYVVGNISLDYVPEGFELETEKVAEVATFLRFKNRDDFFDIFIRSSNYNLSVDTEDAKVETVNLNGHEILYTKKDDISILSGYSGDNTICLTGNIDKNTLCKIYQNINFD